MRTTTKLLIPGAVAFAAILGASGSALISSLQAGAATGTNSSSTTATAQLAAATTTAPDPSQGRACRR